MKRTKVQTLGTFMRVPYIHATVLVYSNVIARTITRVREYEYTHAYNCTLTDQNGRLLCGKQKMLYLFNEAVLGKTLF